MGHSDVKKTFGNLHCQIRCNFKDESLGKFLAIYCDMLDGGWVDVGWMVGGGVQLNAFSRRGQHFLRPKLLIEFFSFIRVGMISRLMQSFQEVVLECYEFGGVFGFFKALHIIES